MRRLGWRGRSALGVALAVAISLPGAAQALSSAPHGRLGLGVAAAGLPADSTVLRSFSRTAGAPVEIVMWYRGFGTDPNFDPVEASRATALGAQPEITLEPWLWTGGVRQRDFRLARIANGTYDDLLRRWAAEIRAWGQPIRVRFAQEMNGTWYPWSEAVNGNHQGDYVRAWRHVHTVFQAMGASNVTWVWSPNVAVPGSLPLARLYPGDAYVDEVGLDGYNWGASRPDAHWQSFAQLFGDSVRQIRAITRRPLFIAEVGSTEIGGSKARWVSDMFAWLRQHPEVRGLTWFNYRKETDWRIESSAASQRAFRLGCRASCAR